MKTKFIAPLLIAALLAGSTVVIGQDRNEKKIERLQRKIEKQSQKLRELTGNGEIVTRGYALNALNPINEEQIAKISDEARAQADEAREHAGEARAQAGEIRARVHESIDQQRVMGRQLKEMQEIDVQRNINGKRYNFYYQTPQFKGQFYSVVGGSQNNLEINKNLIAEESSAADFNFGIKKGTSGIAVDVEGAIDAGKVKVTIKQPNGEEYNEYTLSPLANVNWKQTITIDEENEAAFVGKWTVTVTAEKAKGNYSVKLSER